MEELNTGVPWLKYIGKLNTDTKVKSYTTGETGLSNSRWATCMAACPDRPFVAVGYGTKSDSNLVIYENRLPRQSTRPTPSLNDSDKKPIVADAAPILIKRVAVTVPSPVYSLSWIGEIVTVGSSAGKVLLYKVNLPELVKLNANPTIPTSNLVQYAGKFSVPCASGTDMVAVPLPGVQIPTTRIGDVALCPPAATGTFRLGELKSLSEKTGSQSVFQPQHLLAVQQNQLFLYDLATAKLVSTLELGLDTLFKARWSMHYTSGTFGTMIAAAGSDGAVYVLDQRNGASLSSTSVMAPTIPAAHSGPIRDVQWSPFVPFYLASCGDDSAVHIWDLRYCKAPMASIKSHFVDVGSVAWSNCHLDQLSTGSFDAGWTCWQIPQKSSNFSNAWPLTQSFESQVNPAAPQKMSPERSAPLQAAVSVLSSPTHRNCYYSLAGNGAVTLWHLQPALLELIGDYAFHPKKQSQLYEFQALLQQRNLEQSTDLLLKQQAEDMLSNDQSQELIESTNSPAPRDLEPNWTVGAKNTAENAALGYFQQLKLSQIGRLPPGFCTGLFKNLK